MTLFLDLLVGDTAGYFKDRIDVKPYSGLSLIASSEFYDSDELLWVTFVDNRVFQVELF